MVHFDISLFTNYTQEVNLTLLLILRILGLPENSAV